MKHTYDIYFSGVLRVEVEHDFLEPQTEREPNLGDETAVQAFCNVAHEVVEAADIDEVREVTWEDENDPTSKFWYRFTMN
jgi:hypothetical protein